MKRILSAIVLSLLLFVGKSAAKIVFVEFICYKIVSPAEGGNYLRLIRLPGSIKCREISEGFACADYENPRFEDSFAANYFDSISGNRISMNKEKTTTILTAGPGKNAELLSLLKVSSDRIETLFCKSRGGVSPKGRMNPN